MLEALNIQRDGAAAGTAIAPRLVGQRVDWLTLAFRVVLLADAMATIEKAANLAEKTGGKGAITLRAGSYEWTGEVRRDKQKRYLLEAKDRERILIWESAPGSENLGELGDTPGWNVSIDQSGVSMLGSGLENAMREAWRFCAAIGTPLEDRRRRMDLAVDVVGFPMRGEADGRALVKRSKKQPAFYLGAKGEARAQKRLDFSAEVDETDTRYRLHGYGKDTQTMSVGAGGKIQLRIYDKTTELAHVARDWKLEAEEWGWKRHGWAGERVTRVEFQVMGEALEQFDAERPEEGAPHGMRRGAAMLNVDPVLAMAALRRAKHERADEPRSELEAIEITDAEAEWRLRAADACADADAAKLAVELDGLWQYLTRKWIRIVVPGTASRLARCRIDPRWKAMQEVAWTREGLRPFKRFRRSAGAACKQQFGTNLAQLGRAGRLQVAYDPRTGEVIDDPEAFVDSMTPDEQLRFTFSLHVGTGVLSGNVTAQHFVGEMGARDAAVYSLAKYIRAGARFARSITEPIAPPHPMQDDYRPVRAWLPKKCAPHYGRGATIDMYEGRTA